jgi:two-component system nitrogen regulation response regulator NtrX
LARQRARTAQHCRADDLPILSGDAPPASSYNFDSYREAAEAYEREYILRKLAETEGNVTRTAEVMGIDRSHLYRRMKALGIQSRAGERQGNGN